MDRLEIIGRLKKRKTHEIFQKQKESIEKKKYNRLPLMNRGNAMQDVFQNMRMPSEKSLVSSGSDSDDEPMKGKKKKKKKKNALVSKLFGVERFDLDGKRGTKLTPSKATPSKATPSKATPSIQESSILPPTNQLTPPQLTKIELSVPTDEFQSTTSLLMEGQEYIDVESDNSVSSSTPNSPHGTDIRNSIFSNVGSVRFQLPNEKDQQINLTRSLFKFPDPKTFNQPCSYQFGTIVSGRKPEGCSWEEVYADPKKLLYLDPILWNHRFRTIIQENNAEISQNFVELLPEYEELLESVVGPNVDKHEFCPLHAACEYSSDAIVKQLLKHYDVNTIDPNTGKPPLHVAIENHHPSLIVMLCSNGANVNYCSDRVTTPLCTAISIEDEYILELLLFQFSADVNYRTERIESSPLYACCKTHNHHIFDLLRKSGFLIDSSYGYMKETVLHAMVREGDVEAINLLLQFKKYHADVHFENAKGHAPIHVACLCGDNPDVIRILKRHGGNINQLAKKPGYTGTPLKFSVMKNHFKVAKELLALGADINKKIENVPNKDEEQTVISYAVELGNQKIVELLLLYEPNIEIPTNNTPLMIACSSGHVSIVKLLLNVGANPEVVEKDNRMTPLQIAVECKHPKIVKLLLRYGCNVNHKNVNDENALHIASRTGQHNIVTTLLQYGINADLRNNFRQTPLQISAEHQHFKIVETLLRHFPSKDPNRSSRKTGWDPRYKHFKRKHRKQLNCLKSVPRKKNSQHEGWKMCSWKGKIERRVDDCYLESMMEKDINQLYVRLPKM